MTSRSSKRHECLFDIVICVIFGCSVCSVEYFSLRIPSGERICSTLPPLVSFPARSLITCASQCAPREARRCNFFNYLEDTHRCEIFSDSPFYNYTLAPGCSCFQTRNPLPRDCSDVMTYYYTKRSGVYTVFVGRNIAVQRSVYCDMETSGGGWLVFQRRVNGTVDFYRNWNNYTNGFGNLTDEFWLGNDNLHYITTNGSYKLRIDLEDFDGGVRYAEYQSFYVTAPIDHYKIFFGAYSGNATDSMTTHRGQNFSTLDRDYDTLPSGNCAKLFFGGWWYSQCHSANLNGKYLRGWHSTYADGVEWRAWHGYNYSLKFTEMKIRPM